MSPLSVSHAVLTIIAVQCIVSSAEYLSAANIFKDSGLISWKVNRLIYPKLTRYLQLFKLNEALNYPHFKKFLYLKLLLSLAVIFFIINDYPLSIPLGLLAFISIIIIFRCYRSNNGADQMSNIVLITFAICFIFYTRYSIQIALFFLTAQASLAYATSGFLKLFSKNWRNGFFVIEILKTSIYGNKKILALIKREKKLAIIIISNFVIYCDISLAFAFLLPPKYCLIVIIFGIFLHLGISLVMGLNTFLWSFGAVYPAYYYTSMVIYNHR